MKTAQDRMRALREVALRADDMQRDASNLGTLAAKGLTRSKRSQVTGLESAANGALKATDVLDYVKLRTARHKEWMHEEWGKKLLEYLTGLRKVSESICGDLKLDAKGADAVEVHVMLIREFVDQFSAEYEYRCKLEELQKSR